MKPFTGFTRLLLICLLITRTVFAQTLEFIENKGQWSPAVKFRGDLVNGAFLLQQNGYRVILHHPQDMRRVADYISGHPHATSSAATGDQPGGSGKGNDEQDDHLSSLEAGGRKASGNSGKTTGSNLLLRSHAFEVTFVHSAPNAIVVPDKPLDSYTNYFLGSDSAKWASGCRIYQGVTYKNIYPNIDIRYYTDNGTLKYDFIVYPGGDPGQIVLQFDGVERLDIKNNNLRVQTSVGDINELKPYTYQSSGKGRQEVRNRFQVKNNQVSFRLDEYDTNAPLVIDPSLVFSSFSGSTADNWGFTATYDTQGNLYAGGIVFNPGFPVSNGAFQSNFAGGSTSDNGSGTDIGIIKLSANGSNRIYATYIGGDNNEQPHSLVVDNSGNLVIAGRTFSRNFPNTQPKFGTEGTGDADIFITKLNATGTGLVGSRRFGGSSNDGVNIRTNYGSGGAVGGAAFTRRNYGDDARSEVIVDAANNIYLAAQTQSANFPVTPGVFQPSSAGMQDAVLIKTNGNLSTVNFSSYLGGGSNDAAFVLSLNPNNNNIYIAGGTSSADFPGTSNGPVVSATYNNGPCDGFVSIISNDGSTLIKSSYFGTPASDLIFGIQFDKPGFPYIMGTTTGNWPVTSNAAFRQANGKQFIAKLQPDLSAYVYSTVFGKGQANPDISPTAFLVDRCENVYVSGWGGGPNIDERYENSGTNGLTTTPDAIIPASPQRDNMDFYFFVLKKDAASQLYGSMFGQTGKYGDHVDGGTSRFDKQGVIYQAICANCSGTAVFPTTPGVWSTRNRAAPGCNLAAVKIAFNLSGVSVGLRSAIEGVVNDTAGCIPLRVDFTDTMALGKTYIWRFGDGTPDTITTVPDVSHVFTTVGDYRVRLISIDSATCNVSDTAYMNIRARRDRAIISFQETKVPPCDSLKYEFTNTSVPPPGKPFTDTSFSWNLGDGTLISPAGIQTILHSYAAAGTYNVVLRLRDTAYCNYNDSSSQILRLAVNVKADFQLPPSGCLPFTAIFNNISLGGSRFFWDFGDGTTSQESSPTHLYSNPGNYTIRLVAIDSNTCNIIDSTSRSLVVSGSPTAAFSFSPVPPVENTPTTFTNLSTGATRYLWEYGDGDTLRTISRDTLVQHIYNASGTYQACLTAFNQYSCSDTVCQPVRAIVVPAVDVPNAFTPNGDGVNDVVRVKGYGISKINFSIYNRWGALVFQSNSNKMEGWNGYYKGRLQPQDVYVYVADIEFSDGTKYQKKGDITLLR